MQAFAGKRAGKDLAALWELEMFRQQNPYINKIREEIDTKIIEVQIKQLDNEIKECLRIIQVSESFPEEAYQRYESLKKRKNLYLIHKMLFDKTQIKQGVASAC